jgi:Arc/MetJ-type ribon-helix-helix transcriptional regulator
MTTTVEIKGILEDRLELLVKSGLYASKSEAVRDSIRHLLNELDMKELAFKLYKDGQISTGLALEIAEMNLVSFLEECKQRGIEPKIGIESLDDLKEDIESLVND